jgi:hypothetical protein
MGKSAKSSSKNTDIMSGGAAIMWETSAKTEPNELKVQKAKFNDNVLQLNKFITTEPNSLAAAINAYNSLSATPPSTDVNTVMNTINESYTLLGGRGPLNGKTINEVYAALQTVYKLYMESYEAAIVEYTELSKATPH